MVLRPSGFSFSDRQDLRRYTPLDLTTGPTLRLPYLTETPSFNRQELVVVYSSQTSRPKWILSSLTTKS